MKNITLIFTILLATAMVGCNKPQPQPQFQPQPVVPAQPAQPQPQPKAEPEVGPSPQQPEIVHSASWIRGYNDGYDGNWLGPASWVVSNEYRAGWSAGNRDMKAGKPHRLHNYYE